MLFALQFNLSKLLVIEDLLGILLLLRHLLLVLLDLLNELLHSATEPFIDTVPRLHLLFAPLALER